MKHFHHSIAFTLNERRFIYWAWTPPAGEVYESESGTDPEPNLASEKSESKEGPFQKKEQVEDAAKKRTEQAQQIASQLERESFIAGVGEEYDSSITKAEVPKATPEPAPVESKSETPKPDVAQGDTVPTPPTLPPSGETAPVEPAETAEVPNPNIAGGTQEVSVEGPEADASAEPVTPEQANEKLPETHREVLQKQMDANMAILKDPTARADAKIAAAVGMMGLLKDLMERAYKGTLDEKLGKDEEKAADKPADKPADGSPDSTTANLSPAESAKKKIEENAKVTEGKKTPEDFNKNIDEVKEKNQAERESNTTEIAELDTTIDETKKENDGLIDARGGLEKELNSLNGKEGTEGKQKILQAKIDNINDKIAANTKLIATLDTQRDTLVEQNKKLDAEDTELDRMKKDVNETLAKVTELLEQIVKLLQEQGLDTKMPKITIAVNPDGTTDVSTDSKDKETNVTVEVKEGGEKDLATVNELQQRKQRTILSQESSILKDMPELQKNGGNVLSGGTLEADYWSSEDFGVRYESSSGQWQIQKEEGNWQSPTEYGATDAENTNAVQRLTAFNRELQSIDQLIKEAQDRTEKSA